MRPYLLAELLLAACIVFERRVCLAGSGCLDIPQQATTWCSMVRSLLNIIICTCSGHPSAAPVSWHSMSWSWPHALGWCSALVSPSISAQLHVSGKIAHGLELLQVILWIEEPGALRS